MYHAIMKAADHIEKHPEEFNFGCINIPDGCGSPGCALGWIHAFSGIGGVSYDREIIDAEAILGIADTEFYDRMRPLVKFWSFNAKTTAVALRLYAEKYHADERVQIPKLRLVA